MCVTHINSINLLQWVYLFHGVDLLLADEVSNGRHRPLTPVLPLHHHSIAEQLQRRILGDAVPLGYVRYAEAEAEEKLNKEGRINWWGGRGRVKTHGHGGMRSGAVTETVGKPENTAFSQLLALISHMKAAPRQE